MKPAPTSCPNSPKTLLRQRQEHFFRERFKLARRHGLPVILHVRRSVDQVLKGLREIGVPGGIAHAFNGSRQQADMFLDMGFRLGFGGAVTYERATRLRALAAQLPAEAIVMETDAPDIPPHWLYATAEQRAAGHGQGRNEPGEPAAHRGRSRATAWRAASSLGRDDYRQRAGCAARPAALGARPLMAQPQPGTGSSPVLRTVARTSCNTPARERPAQCPLDRRD